MIDRSKLPPEKQLDFWLGEWNVSWGENQHGTNRVEQVLDGRVIQESFDGSPAIDFRGKSWSVYSAKRGIWQQTWVDTEGNYWNFTGGVEGDTFFFATDDVVEGKPVRLRMVFYNIDRDTLDWRWERSENGETWQVLWQIHYLRK